MFICSTNDKCLGHMLLLCFKQSKSRSSTNHQQIHDKCTLSLNWTMSLDSFGGVWMLSLSECDCEQRNFMPLNFFLFFMYHTALLISSGMAFAIDSFQQLDCLCHSTGVCFFKSWHPPPPPTKLHKNIYIYLYYNVFVPWLYWKFWFNRGTFSPKALNCVFTSPAFRAFILFLSVDMREYVTAMWQ